MAAVFLKRLSAAAALLAMGACAYVTPYPEAFPAKAGDADPPCRIATNTPGIPDAVRDCLEARGREWDSRGVAIRRQAGFVGQMSIPLGVAGLALSAADDSSDFVPLSAGVTGAALAHTGAYARPSQAEVYELATEAYRCLISGVTAWNGAGRSVVTNAYNDLMTKNARALAALRGQDGLALEDDERVAAEDRVVTQADTARRVSGMLDGSIGTALLRRSDEIDAAAIRAIRDRLPDPQAVAASVARSGPVTETVQKVGASGIQAVQEEHLGRTPGVTTLNLANRNAAIDAANRQRQRSAAEVRRLVSEADRAADAFNAAVRAYKPVTMATTCTFNPSSLPGLAATPNAVVLDANGIGRFVLRSGVPPYGNIPAPDGLNVTLIPLNSSATSVEVKATAGANGPWTLQMMDSSSAGSVVEVQVRRP